MMHRVDSQWLRESWRGQAIVSPRLCQLSGAA